jgi:hypothetical protein
LSCHDWINKILLYYKVQKCISLNKTIVIDISLELVLKIIFIYKINQIDFAAIHAAINNKISQYSFNLYVGHYNLILSLLLFA